MKQAFEDFDVHRPRDENSNGRVLEEHRIGEHEAQRADQMERLIDRAVMVIAMIVPALCLQRLFGRGTAPQS